MTASAARPAGLPNPSLALPHQDALIHEAFERQARDTPEALALQSAYGVCSFGELDRISQSLASFLSARGLGPGKTVALFSDRNPALIYCLLGVLRSGAAFQVLDAAYPVARNLSCLQQTAPDFLLIAGDLEFPAELTAAAGLSGAEHLARIPAQAGAAARFLSGQRTDAVASSRARPDQAAYFSFTSGSTGAPKGIVTAHSPLPHFVAWHVAHGPLSHLDRFSMLSGL
ncbi:MAG: amino acid adenylation domain protein, partial [Myxococcaceae bacterium]|nr:amino acid adenylation domain protein [Myxococcaceae bacterium]